jgi:hypothetical protein
MCQRKGRTRAVCEGKTVFGCSCCEQALECNKVWDDYMYLTSRDGHVNLRRDGGTDALARD